MTQYLDGLPSALRIGPFDLSVAIVEKIEHKDEEESVGLHVPGERIELRREMPNAAFVLNVVLHEINHAIYHACGLDDDSTEEQVCQGIAASWVAILRDNPELLTWMKKTSLMIPTNGGTTATSPVKLAQE